MRITEAERDFAEFLPGTLVLVAGEILIQQLQAVRYHPNG